MSNARYFNGVQISSVHLFFRASFLSVFLGKGIIVTERSAHQNYMASKWVSLSYTKSGGRGTERERGLSGLIHCHSKPPIWIELQQHYNLLWAFFVPNSFPWVMSITNNKVLKYSSPLFMGSSMVNAQYLKVRIHHLFSWDKAKSCKRGKVGYRITGAQI